MRQPLTPLRHRFLAALFGFLIGLTTAQFFNHTPTNEQPSQSAIVEIPETHDEKILAALIPDGNWAYDSQLGRFRREDVVRVLYSAQSSAYGERAAGIAYLLAILNEDYNRNRNQLVNSLAGCRALNYPDKNSCADMISSYLRELERRGDTSLIGKQFAIYDLADGAIASDLGMFYSYELRRYSEPFLAALNQFPKRDQQSICQMAAFEDGGGMADEDHAAAVDQLRTMTRKRELSTTATNCLRVLKLTRKRILIERAKNK